MIKNICITAVKEKYREHLKSQIDRLQEHSWNIHILTDKPEEFLNFNTDFYPYTIFSYIDKILYPIRKSLEIKEPVLSVDANKLVELTDEFLEKGTISNNFMYLQKWPNGEYLDFFDNSYFKVLIEYFQSISFDYHKLPCLVEQVFYTPYFPQLKKTLTDIEHIKPIMEYLSVLHNFPSPGVGNGEGIALAYGIINNNFNLEKFHLSPFGRSINNRFI